MPLTDPIWNLPVSELDVSSASCPRSSPGRGWSPCRSVRPDPRAAGAARRPAVADRPASGSSTSCRARTAARRSRPSSRSNRPACRGCIRGRPARTRPAPVGRSRRRRHAARAARRGRGRQHARGADPRPGRSAAAADARRRRPRAPRAAPSPAGRSQPAATRRRGSRGLGTRPPCWPGACPTPRAPRQTSRRCADPAAARSRGLPGRVRPTLPRPRARCSAAWLRWYRGFLVRGRPAPAPGTPTGRSTRSRCRASCHRRGAC